MKVQDRLDDVLDAYGAWIIRHRWIALAISLMVAALCTSGIRYVGFANDYRSYLGEDDPQLKAFDDLQAIYAKEDGMFIGLAPDDGNVFTNEFLQALESLTEEAWRTPFVTRVQSITNFQHSESKDDDVIIRDLVSGAHDLTPEDIERVREIALADSWIVHNIVSPDASVAAIGMYFTFPGKASDEMEQAVTFADGMIERLHQTHPGIKTYLTGTVHLNTTVTRYTIRDLLTLTPLMFCLIAIVLAVLLRSVAATFGSILVILLTGASALGMPGWLGIKFSGPSATMPTIVMTLAVADCVHILVTFIQRMREGDEKNAALIHSLRVNFVPVALTTTTTCVGFLTMNFIDVPPLRDMGNMTAASMLGALFYSVVFLPAFLAIFPVRIKSAERHSSRSTPVRLANFVIRYRTAILVVSVCCLGVLVPGLLRNEFNNNVRKWFRSSVPIRQDTEFMLSKSMAGSALDFSINATGPGGITDPAYLRKVEEFEQWLLQQPNVLTVLSYTEVARRLNETMHNDDPAWRRISDDKPLNAQYLLLYEMSLPYGSDLTNYINIDKSAIRVRAMLDFPDDLRHAELAGLAENWLRDNAPEHMFTHATGPSVVFASVVQSTIRGMLQGTFVALLFVSLLLIFVLRSLRLGILSLVPNLIPLILAFGVWGFLVGRINFGVAVVSGMAIGIVVDDTVHFLSKYLRARRLEGCDPEEAVRYAITSVGPAMFITTLVLMLGFGTQTISNYLFTANMGLLTALTVVLAFVADILVLPALLITFDRRGPQSHAEEGEV